MAGESLRTIPLSDVHRKTGAELGNDIIGRISHFTFCCVPNEFGISLSVILQTCFQPACCKLLHL